MIIIDTLIVVFQYNVVFNGLFTLLHHVMKHFMNILTEGKS